jgi:hypothetical protein
MAQESSEIAKKGAEMSQEGQERRQERRQDDSVKQEKEKLAGLSCHFRGRTLGWAAF